MADRTTARTNAAIARWACTALWVLLPLTAGAFVADVVAGWSNPSRVAAEALAWATWIIGVVAVLIPRPSALTALRILAPGLLALAALGARDTTLVVALVTLAQLLALSVLAWSAPFARVNVDAISYGTEERFPLRVPPALWMGPIPIAIALAVGVPFEGALCITSGRVALGVVVLVVGLPLAALAVRSLHGLATRFVVFVPAGVTIVDSFTLSAPVHIPRREVARLTEASGAPAADAADLRVGAVRSSCAMELVDPTEGLPVRRGRTGTEAVATREIWIAPMARLHFLASAATHRVGQTATAPPTNSSFT